MLTEKITYIVTLSIWTDWPRMEQIKTLLARYLVSPLLWAKSSSGVTVEGSTWQGVQPVTVVASHPWRSRASELLTMSRPRHKLAAGLQTGHTALTAHVFNVGLTKHKDCRLCGHVKAAWRVCAIARLWYAKDTESGVVCFCGLRIWKKWGSTA